MLTTLRVILLNTMSLRDYLNVFFAQQEGQINTVFRIHSSLKFYIYIDKDIEFSDYKNGSDMVRMYFLQKWFTRYSAFYLYFKHFRLAA